MLRDQSEHRRTHVRSEKEWSRPTVTGVAGALGEKKSNGEEELVQGGPWPAMLRQRWCLHMLPLQVQGTTLDSNQQI